MEITFFYISGTFAKQHRYCRVAASHGITTGGNAPSWNNFAQTLNSYLEAI